MNAEELLNDTKKWKKRINFLQQEFAFLSSLLEANIFNPEINDLFETLLLYKEEIGNITNESNKILDSLISHESHIEIYLESDDINFDHVFIEIHSKKEYDVTVFLEETNKFKIQLYDYIKRVVIR
ncbi:hypothetical protein C1H87_22500 [Flavivirga eckloniae]|uniref:Uncharacterized protein n=2 Tax=Flavivirga eckloniae TaxID=1803846 RepID=A0A2K9PWA0_9FLAO|nr:hypothetical protein C1H87_22500 [Flavivirga eckloniae]